MLNEMRPLALGATVARYVTTGAHKDAGCATPTLQAQLGFAGWTNWRTRTTHKGARAVNTTTLRAVSVHADLPTTVVLALQVALALALTVAVTYHIKGGLMGQK